MRKKFAVTRKGTTAAKKRASGASLQAGFEKSGEAALDANFRHQS
jgi:hypothetical protein